MGFIEATKLCGKHLKSYNFANFVKHEFFPNARI